MRRLGDSAQSMTDRAGLPVLLHAESQAVLADWPVDDRFQRSADGNVKIIAHRLGWRDLRWRRHGWRRCRCVVDKKTVSLANRAGMLRIYLPAIYMFVSGTLTGQAELVLRRILIFVHNFPSTICMLNEVDQF